ncbi:Protein of unknown function [Agromyces sp. CF514]|uniref:DUF2510 domain-containing protein n=1 Tax=Agromyces sp. CF514 TaxID=1881031 RepID=UPI0008E5A100|nr:DUF2510 domain-containing protein [Agromyces sp. CF514]SFR66235.1 Protein of unknown function [Agromyces sp. CF514]
MTNELAHSAPAASPAGWYPDPSGAPTLRWWDGLRWTEHTTAGAAGASGAPVLRPYGEHLVHTQVPAGTPTSTPWIWLMIALPLLGVIPLFGFDMTGYMVDSITDPMAQFRMYLDPWYLSALVLGWTAYGLGVWFAALDRAELRRRGFGRQFHWAWTFLSSLVYVIGRSVVVKRQAGRGTAPMHVAIWTTVATFIGTMIWVIVMTAQLVQATMEYSGAYAGAL